MKAHIITIGDEILIGQTVDTNSAWIGKQLSSLGFNVNGISSVHDLREDILEALKSAEDKSDVIIITGGLGPTSDDITKQTLCDFFNTHPVVNQEVLAMIEVMMKRRGIPMNENNRKQAEVPETCIVLKNIRDAIYYDRTCYSGAKKTLSFTGHNSQKYNDIRTVRGQAG
jgi:nicotinamide-nucleotide amidase